MRQGLAKVLQFLVILTVVCTSAIPTLAASAACKGLIAADGRDHPLTCSIFTGDARASSWKHLGGELSESRHILLGEVHDNAHQHVIRAALISGLDVLAVAYLGDSSERHYKGALVFEHIRADTAAALKPYNTGRHSHDYVVAAAGLPTLLEWDKSGWPTAVIFEPLFMAAAAGRFEIFPGDPPRADVRRVAREGLATLAEPELQRLKLDAPLSQSLQDALLTELEVSHCGLMPKTAFGNMAVAQRYRDAHLAAALRDAAEAHGRAILLAGNGHVRSDRGVPYYLRQMAPGQKITSVLFLEVEDGKTDPAAYVPRSPDGNSTADYIIFTPRAERPDPCVEMKKHFGAPRQ